MESIKKILARGIILALLALPLSGLMHESALADSKSQIQTGINDANGGSQPKSSSLDATVTNAINLLSTIVGLVAVIMIIVGGFRYITSGGKQESVSGAKNTILYALIGLVIVAFAQIIVNFVLDKSLSTCVNNKTPSGQKCTP